MWHDEFDGAALDTTKWARETGGHGWGNNELEFYTDRVENARLENGYLVIEARSEPFGNQAYTSARLKTQGLGARRYGRIVARIQIPRGQGLWPACWMLGDNISLVGWPACGEIDMQWFVDDTLFRTILPSDPPGPWVYDHPFFIILNVAVGGYWPGNPDTTTVFPQTMRVDYVRVYQNQIGEPRPSTGPPLLSAALTSRG